MAIFLTGDIHGDPRILSADSFPNGGLLSKEDYVIILGDFGLLWDKEMSGTENYWLNWLNSKPFTTLFIDGNHENFNRLNDYPIEEWHGGKIHRIKSSVIHLMRGQVFEICGKRIFTMGGAASHDIQDGILERGKDDELIKKWNKDLFKMFRIKNESWWEAEVPDNKERFEAIRNLDACNWNVDFVLTHEAPSSIVHGFVVNNGDKESPHEYSKWLEQINTLLYFKHWYFGHYHITWDFPANFSCLYEDVIQIA